MRALWIVALVGCGTSDPSEPFHFSLLATWSDVPGTEVDPRPTVFMDGIATEQLELDFASAEDALGQTHVLELRHGNLVVASRSIRVGGAGSCLGGLTGTPIRVSTSWCALSSGDLRYFAGEAASRTADGGTQGCTADGFCAPGCFPMSGCNDGTRCTSIYASTDPIATHLRCAPAGAKGLGDSCTLVSDEHGTHDDCGDLLLCVDHICRQTCSVHDLPSADCAACTQVHGHAPEIGVCE